MAVLKRIGLGMQLSISSSTGTPFANHTVIAGLLSADGPDGTADDVDTSTIDQATNDKSFQRGQFDPGDLTMELAYGATDPSQSKLGTARATGQIREFLVTDTVGGTTESFSGYIKGMGRAIEKDSMVTRSVTVKITGDPGFNTT